MDNDSWDWWGGSIAGEGAAATTTGAALSMLPPTILQLVMDLQAIAENADSSADNTDIVEHAVLALLGIEVKPDFECHVANAGNRDDVFDFNFQHDGEIKDAFIKKMDELFPGVLRKALEPSHNTQSVRAGSTYTFLCHFHLDINEFRKQVMPRLEGKIRELRAKNEAYRAEQRRKEPLQNWLGEDTNYYTDNNIAKVIAGRSRGSRQYDESLSAAIGCTVMRAGEGFLHICLPPANKDSCLTTAIVLSMRGNPWAIMKAVV